MTTLLEAMARALSPRSWIDTPVEDFDGTQKEWDGTPLVEKVITSGLLPAPPPTDTGKDS